MDSKKPYNGNSQAVQNEPAEMGPLSKMQTSQIHYVQPNSNTKQTLVYQHPQLMQPNMWGPVPRPTVVHYLQQKTETAATVPTKQWIVSKAFEPAEVKQKKSGQQLKFPSPKKPPTGNVTLKGWLYKQGAEGLRVWRKRWFVLSDYCLYYYKGPDEEKVLGAILLPSYKVSKCTPEDKVNRKFAFKCEHANMRTYFLAAESYDSMMEWVRLINLACVLQSNVETPDLQPEHKLPAKQSSNIQSRNEQTIHQQYPPHQHTNAYVGVQAYNPKPDIQQNHPSDVNCVQPLYANAPPKPRRLTDGGYSSPSPEFSLDRYNIVDPKYHYSQTVPLIHNNVVRNVPPNCVKPMIYCDNHMVASPYVHYGHQAQTPYNKMNHSVYDQHVQTVPGEVVSMQNVERRTPDTYGRSKLNCGKNKDTSDYEDVYSDELMYKRPLSPMNYSNIKKVSPIATIPMQHRPYPSLYASDFPKQELLQGYKIHSNEIHPGARAVNTVPRPHSADFLEYEVKFHNSNRSHLVNAQPRPKSSLDINRTSNDNFFYSKESYAKNIMRKSAIYLQQQYPVTKINPSQQKTCFDEAPRYTRQKMINNNQNYLMSRSSTQPCLPFEEEYHQRKEPPPLRSDSVLSDGSLDVDMSPSPYSKNLEQFSRGQRDHLDHQDQFVRSASARLMGTSSSKILSEDSRHFNKEGERKREESMKRLLEWKQRMLQSPLNRKQLVLRPYANVLPDFYPKQLMEVHGQSYPMQESRRSMNNISQYNSYSSDDEENDLNRSRKEKVVRSKLLQAGRTKEGHSDKPLLTPSPALNASTTSSAFELPLSSSRPSESSNNNNESANHSKNVPCIDNNNKPDLDNSLGLNIIKKVNDSPNKNYNTNKLFETNKIEEDQVYEHLVLTPKFSNNNFEENYITMNLKKSIFDNTEETKDDDVRLNELGEENAYMEMSRGILEQNDISSPEGENNDVQPYEIICFAGDSKTEPVYMELNQSVFNEIETKNKKKQHEESQSEKIESLPDILVASQNNKSNKSTKSDSSDADDEASKDLDSLDTPCHPRFSLSDTFRPASYYLGPSRALTEFHDSSDSELVSPPPIPTSPPPMDDLDNSYAEDDEQKVDSNNKKIGYLSADNLKQQDSVSLYSIDRCLSSRSSHNSDVELRTAKNTTDYERILKRRPVSGEFYDELESLDSRFNETQDSIDLDKYLKDLEDSDISNVSKLMPNDSINQSTDLSISLLSHEYENLCNVSGDAMQQLHATESNNSSLNSSHNNYRAQVESAADDVSDLIQTMTIEGISSEKNHTHSTSMLLAQSAPYYYSDLSIDVPNGTDSSLLTLNNQRTSTTGSKRDITRIINPIRCNNSSQVINQMDNTFKLAAEARSVSADFLNLADKPGQIDKKNVYESDTLKRVKAMDSMSSLQSNPETINLYSHYPVDKIFAEESTSVRRTYSLEGLLENVLTNSATPVESLHESSVTIPTRSESSFNTASRFMLENRNTTVTSEGSQIWEEDSVWHERLRSASQRHTRSLDDLDSICNSVTSVQTKNKQKLSRGVTYVNDNLLNMVHIDKKEKNDEQESTDSNKNEVWDITSTMLNKEQSDTRKPIAKEDLKSKAGFVMDRETLRQWDLLSSAPSGINCELNGQGTAISAGSVVETPQGIGNDRIMQPCEQTEIDVEDSASGSIALTNRETFPRIGKNNWAGSESQSKIPTSLLQERPPSTPCIPLSSSVYLTDNIERDYYHSVPHRNSGDWYDFHERPLETRKTGMQWNGRMNMSAGELLGRTHEELVLLLIQLRRQSASTCHAIESGYTEIENIQSTLSTLDKERRLENLQKLEQLKQHLLELEKQYEKGRPLVNLVDNMVKLGSLYRSPGDKKREDRFEFNQHIQEQRLLAEERRNWTRLSPSHAQLQEKVQQLYKLDLLLTKESSTLLNLRRDKEKLERALLNLKHHTSMGIYDPVEIDKVKKQQMELESELSRVHQMLAYNSKKLEETVAGNARLEQELLVLRQKLQLSRQHRNSSQFSNAGDSLQCTVGTSAMLEAELHRVQQLVGDLQRQRNELGRQVKHLTQQHVRTINSVPVNQNTSTNKKRSQTSWRETDLDTMHSINHDTDCEQIKSRSSTPLYMNTESGKQEMVESDQFYGRSSLNDYQSSDSQQSNTGSTVQEKQEIKTVRIVKRESERRQRDREKSAHVGNSAQSKWDAVVEEDNGFQNFLYSSSSNNDLSSSPPNSSESNLDYIDKNNPALNRQTSISSPSLPLYIDMPHNNSNSDIRATSTNDVNLDKSPVLSPIFKSEAARQIINEMSGLSTESVTKRSIRRLVPKEKRRHYTAPHNNLIKSLNQLPTLDTFNSLESNNRRARDDMDMERALRQRNDTPDVVRSTLSNKELKYNENTIDNILGTPNKISIPERYIPEQLPQLSPEEQQHRLKKVESIKKMLSDTTILSSTPSTSVSTSGVSDSEKTVSNVTTKTTSKMVEEKKQREHLLQLNQILAKQVMEMSKIVAVKALATLPLEPQRVSLEEDDLSPVTPLPLYQQRDNYYT